MNYRFLLVGALGVLMGFTLSWNPQQNQIARHVIGTENLDLAATAPTKVITGSTEVGNNQNPSGKIPTDVIANEDGGSEIIDLGAQDPNLRGITVTFARNEDVRKAKTHRYQINLGTHANNFCNDCIEPVSSVSGSANNIADLRLLITGAAIKELRKAKNNTSSSRDSDDSEKEEADYEIDSSDCDDTDGAVEKMECLQDLAQSSLNQCSKLGKTKGLKLTRSQKAEKKREAKKCQKEVLKFARGPLARVIQGGLKSRNEEIRDLAITMRDEFISDAPDALNSVKSTLIQNSALIAIQRAQLAQSECTWGGVAKCQPGIAANNAKSVLYYELTGNDVTGGSLIQKFGAPMMSSLRDAVEMSTSGEADLSHLFKTQFEDPIAKIFKTNTSKGLDLNPLLSKLGVGSMPVDPLNPNAPHIDEDQDQRNPNPGPAPQGLAGRNGGRGQGEPYTAFGQQSPNGAPVPKTNAPTQPNTRRQDTGRGQTKGSMDQ